MIMSLIYVFFGGGVGSVLRYLISTIFKNHHFPLATLYSNILSCLILALGIMIIQKCELSNNVNLFLIIGFCGGLSTFLTFCYETINLLRLGYMNYAFLNILFSIVVCCSVLYILMKNL